MKRAWAEIDVVRNKLVEDKRLQLQACCLCGERLVRERMGRKWGEGKREDGDVSGAKKREEDVRELDDFVHGGYQRGTGGGGRAYGRGGGNQRAARRLARVEWTTDRQGQTGSSPCKLVGTQDSRSSHPRGLLQAASFSSTQTLPARVEHVRNSAHLFLLFSFEPGVVVIVN